MIVVTWQKNDPVQLVLPHWVDIGGGSNPDSYLVKIGFLPCVQPDHPPRAFNLFLIPLLLKYSAWASAAIHCSGQIHKAVQHGNEIKGIVFLWNVLRCFFKMSAVHPFLIERWWQESSFNHEKKTLSEQVLQYWGTIKWKVQRSGKDNLPVVCERINSQLPWALLRVALENNLKRASSFLRCQKLKVLKMFL